MRIRVAITVAVSGIALIIGGVAIWSIPAAMVLAGAFLLAVGGLVFDVESE